MCIRDRIDGFKPAHRKLLYTMYEMGLLKGARTKSCLLYTSGTIWNGLRLAPAVFSGRIIFKRAMPELPRTLRHCICLLYTSSAPINVGKRRIVLTNNTLEDLESAVIVFCVEVLLSLPRVCLLYTSYKRERLDFQAQKKIASAEILPTNAIFSFL